MLAEVVHTSMFDELPLLVSIGWTVMGLAALVYGARLFHWVAYLPACVKRGPWFALAYGLTGYGVARIGWVFDARETAQHLWAPLVYISAAIALIGGVTANSRLIRALPRLGDKHCALCDQRHRPPTL